MPDDRSQAQKDQETIDYYVNHVPHWDIVRKIKEAEERLARATEMGHSIHYSWLLQILETAKPLRLAKEKDGAKT